MALQVNTAAPLFAFDAYDPKSKSVKNIALAQFKGKWVVLFFYPADFTFVCPTELEDLAKRQSDFDALGCQIIGVSTDTVYSHKMWLESEELLKPVQFLLAADRNGAVSKAYGVYDEASGNASRGAFIIDPDGKLMAYEVNAEPVGRCAAELVRKLKAFKFVRENKGQVCPASWETGHPTLKPGVEIAGKVAKALRK